MFYNVRKHGVIASGSLSMWSKLLEKVATCTDLVVVAQLFNLMIAMAHRWRGKFDPLFDDSLHIVVVVRLSSHA